MENNGTADRRGGKGGKRMAMSPPPLGRSLRARIEGRGKVKERAGEGAVVDLEPAPPPPLWATNCMHNAVTHGTHDM